jgi:hypothetical protein
MLAAALALVTIGPARAKWSDNHRDNGSFSRGDAATGGMGTDDSWRSEGSRQVSYSAAMRSFRSSQPHAAWAGF